MVTASRRTNIACFNHGSVTATCRATVYLTEGSVQARIDLSVPPFSSVQRSLDGLDPPEPGGDVLFSTPSGWLTGYIVVNDNVTNDGDVYLASYRELVACTRIFGVWTGFFVDRCGDYGAGYVTITQSGCSFTMSSSIGNVSGRIWGNTGGFDISVAPCSGSAGGEFTVFSQQGISGTYSGTVSGSGCCGPSLSGSFTLGR